MKRPPIPHPLEQALVESGIRALGLDPAEVEDWMRWRKPIPRHLVEKVTTVFWPRIPPDSWWVEGQSLPSVENRAIVRREMQTENSTKRLGRPPTDHPFTRALHEKGMSVAEWATAHDIPSPTVSSWFLGKNARRRIPMSVAQQIEKELGVPLDAWKNGIRYDLKKKL